MNNIYHLLLFLTIGIWGAWLGREATILLPFAAILMLTVGMLAHLLPEQSASWQPWALIALVQFYALTLGVMSRRNFLLASAFLGTACFFLGLQYLPQRPEIASALYYMIGVVLCGLIMCAIGGSMGLVLMTYLRTVAQRREADAESQPKKAPAHTHANRTSTIHKIRRA